MPVPSTIRTPGLVLDLERLDAGLARVADVAAAAGVALFPHAKTHRMPELARRQLASGAHGLTVAKLGEAEGFADALPELGRVFVAYPVAGGGVPERALALDARLELRLGVDSLDGARLLGPAFAAAGRRIRLMLAVDTGYGREGVAPDRAAGVAHDIAAVDGVELVGVYTFEGTAYAATDPDDLAARAATAAGIMRGVAETVRTATGLPLPVVSMGSSPSFAAVGALAAPEGITELRPGIAPLGDASQIALSLASEGTVAMRVVTTVVSHPEPGRVCIDAGVKALGADRVLASAFLDRYPGHGILIGQDGWQLDRLSEEHGWLRWHGAGDPPPLAVGERLELIPAHACLVFAALRRATVVSHGEVVAVWEGLGPGASE